MEGFNDLLLKLRDFHEREVEGWQVKVQELSNKKGCDTKRMEELFTRNQQMKEQQRLLTENIKTLENRLRAGLCDRCTVTQEVAKKRQQEYEASQIQSLQHISLLAGEINNLKKENKKLRDEIRSLRAALDRSHSDHSSTTSTSTEVKSHSSPDMSPSSVPMALIAAPTNSIGSLPSEGNGAVKIETDQRSEEAEHRQLRGINRNHFEPYKPFPLTALTLPSRKPDLTVSREKRSTSVEGLDQRSSIPPHPLILKSSSPPSREVNPSRHVLHAPVPCRPQPIKGSPVAFPWSLFESSDWVSAAGASMVLQPPAKPSMPRFPNLIPNSQHASHRRQVFVNPWQKQSTSQPPAKEPSVVFRLKSLEEPGDNPITPQEKKEVLPYKMNKPAAWCRDACEGPLDLSDRGKPKSSQTPREYSPLTTQDAVQKSPDKDARTNPSPHAVSSPSPVIPSSSSSSPQAKQQEESTGDNNHKQVVKDQELKEEVNGKTGQSNEKKVPVLTISLRPVVVLETLNSALQKQESLPTNGKTSSPAAEPGSSADEMESVSGQESSQSCKRKRSAVETEAESDTDNTQHERKMKIAGRSEEKSPS